MRNANQQSLFSFESDLQKFAKKIDVELGTVIKKVVLELHNKIVLRTPVDTGRARASWGIAVDQRPGAAAVAPPRSKSKGSSGAATAAAKQQQNFVKVADPKTMAYRVWWIFNNLPYIQPLEYGHSQQAPAGMVRVSLAEIEMEISRMIR